MLDLQDLKELYRLDEEHGSASLEEYTQCVKYYHGNQLRAVDLETIMERGQTPVIENIFKMIINKILGYKSQSIGEVIVSGRQQEDRDLAFLLNDLLKVFTNSDFYVKELGLKERELIFGRAVCKVWIKEDHYGDRFVDFKTIPNHSFFVDRNSQDITYGDAIRFHELLEMDYGEAKSVFGRDFIYEGGFLDGRVKLVESWVKNGNKWGRYFWNKNSLILYEESPIKDGSHPYALSSFQLDERGGWYGLFRDIKPMQDYVNFAENKLGNMLGSFKALFEADAVTDPESFIEAIGYDNAVVKVNPGSLTNQKFQFIQHHADIQALTAKVLEKRTLAKTLAGLNDEFLGISNVRSSGEAIAQRREAGLMGLQDFLNKSDILDRLIFKKVINLMQLYFTKKQVFKIVDKNRAERYFSINDNETNQIRVGRFDLEFKTKLKIDTNEERFIQWSEIIKSINATQPELVRLMLPLILKDIDSPIAQDVVEILEKQEELQREARESLVAQIETQRAVLELEKLKMDIQETRAKAGKYVAQGQLANSIVEDNNKDSMQKGGQDLR